MGLCGGVGVVVVPTGRPGGVRGSRWTQAGSGKRCWRGVFLGATLWQRKVQRDLSATWCGKVPIITCVLQRYNDN